MCIHLPLQVEQEEEERKKEKEKEKKKRVNCTYLCIQTHETARTKEQTERWTVKWLDKRIRRSEAGLNLLHKSCQRVGRKEKRNAIGICVLKEEAKTFLSLQVTSFWPQGSLSRLHRTGSLAKWLMGL